MIRRMKSVPEQTAMDELEAQLQSFELDDPNATLTFSRRLARENAWSHDFALRAIREYKRFVYLAMKAGHPVTPSEEVDQVWHLHLTYTRSYWEEMCGKILPRPLHHGPTMGGKAENEKYEDWYARTLDSYERVYGERPTAEIWPSVQERFLARPRWVDQERFLVLRKPTKRAMLMAAVGTGAALVLTGCLQASLLADTEEEGGLPIVLGAIIAMVAVWVILGVFRRKNGRGGRGCGGFFGGCGGGGDDGDSGDGGGGCGGGCGGD